MAEAIAIWIITAVAGAAAAGGAVLAVTTFLVGLAISVGISVLAQLFLNRAPEAKPSDRQFIVAAPIMARVRAYGRVRLGGAQIFVATENGSMLRVVAHHDGEVDDVEEHIIDDTTVSLDGDGWVTNEKYQFKGYPAIRIRWRIGDTDPAPYTDLTARVPEWASTSLGKGVAHSLTEFVGVPLQHFTEYYPNGERTAYKQTVKASRIWDPRDPAQDADDAATWLWSDNAALVCLDHQRHAMGLRLPLDWISPEIETWKTAADICDEAMPLAAGGEVARYRAWGSYSYDERPGDVQSRILATCNGRIMFGASGGIGLSVGVWTQPTVELGDDAIVDYDIASGSEAPDAANVLTASYVEPALGYIESDAAPWVDAAAVAQFGEQRQDAKLYMVPHHNQVRRLMKQAAAKIAPEWQGTLKTNLRGLVALSERFIRIRISEADLVFTAEIDRVEFIIERGSIVTGLVITYSSVDATAFEFDAETEEGTPSATPSPLTSSGLSGVANFDVVIEGRGSYAVGVASWEALANVALRVQLEYRLSGGGEWLLATPSGYGATSCETPMLTDGAVYEFRAIVQSAEQSSPYSATITRTVTVDPTAPDAPESPALVLAGSVATVTSTGSPSGNMHGIRIYRYTASDSAAATLEHTVFVGPSVGISWADSGLEPGTYWWWVASINFSGVESARVLAGSGTVA